MDISPNEGSLSPQTPHDDSGEDHMMMLTRLVQRFSEALGGLKDAVRPPSVGLGACHETCESKIPARLNEVIVILKDILSKYPPLHTTELLTATSALFAACKDVSNNVAEDGANDSDVEKLLSVINNLALVLTRCVSDYWMCEADYYDMTRCEEDGSTDVMKTKALFTRVAATNRNSLDCLLSAAGSAISKPADNGISSDVTAFHPQFVGDDLNVVLNRLESGVELALMRAQSWSKYTKDLVLYVERRTNAWGEFARNLQKLVTSIQQSINDDSFLPFQAIYNTALMKDLELANMSQAARILIQNQTFVAPLNARRAEHDKTRKRLKYSWTKQLRKMQDAVSNMRKARSAYIARQQEYEKLKDSAQRAELACTTTSTGVAAGGIISVKADSRVEKKKKQEDEAMQKAIESEAAYKMSVEEANVAQQQLIQLKQTILCDIRKLLTASDNELKKASVAYFKLMNTITDTIPQQFLSLSDGCRSYEPGSHYTDFIHHLSALDHPAAIVEPFMFESYPVTGRMSESFGSDMHAVLRDSFSCSPPATSPDVNGRGSHGPAATFRVDDSDSVSGGSTLSLEYSPTTSNHGGGSYSLPSPHRTLVFSTSICEMQESQHDNEHIRYDSVEDSRGSAMFHGVRLSSAAQTHSLRKLRTPSRCRECDSFIYFQGAECEKCGMASHRKCLELFRAVCKNQTMSYMLETFDVPYLVKHCIREINRRGLSVKGIYRVSSVKSKVEQVCQSFDMEESIDLSDQHPNIIANVLKLYLRQLPEPLLTFKLYPMLIQLAKEDMSRTTAGSGCRNVLTTLASIMEQLPLSNYKTCAALMHHLNKIAKNHYINQMTASNLGIIFGPTLLRPKEGPCSLEYLIDTPYQTRIIELLVNNVTALFGADDTFGVDYGTSIEHNKYLHDDLTEFNSEALNSPITTWFAPESTFDLLQELAKEEPHFQHLRQNSTVSCTNQNIDEASSPAADNEGAVAQL